MRLLVPMLRAIVNRGALSLRWQPEAETPSLPYSGRDAPFSSSEPLGLSLILRYLAPLAATTRSGDTVGQVCGYLRSVCNER